MQVQDQRRSHHESRPAEDALPAADRQCRISLVPAPESTGTARDFTVATLRGWYLDALIQDAMMVVSELVANAIRHGAARTEDNADEARVELSWSCEASRLICAVTDRSCEPPVLGRADHDAECGRGLQVVHALTIAWGWTALSTKGKAVWAAFQLPGTSRLGRPRALSEPRLGRARRPAAALASR